jgi:hypothetical protein|tara:strand:- start:49 stop:246 length:198 start_codon:yes stop_codon:yes gene_type:complete
MKFFQKEDGSCDIVFSQEEIKTLNETKKISFTAEGLRIFSNDLMRMIVEFNNRFDEEVKNKTNQD